MADVPERSDLRASDQDREKVVAILQEHFAQGRLDQEEFDERTTTAYQAKTFGDLAPLTRDLPVEKPAGGAEQEKRPERPWYRSGWGRMSPWAIFGLIGVVFLVLQVVGVGHLPGWPFWIFLPWIFMAVGGGHSRRRHRYEEARERLDREYRHSVDRGDQRGDHRG